MFKNFKESYFTIQNQRIDVREGEINQDELLFYTENPRIYSIVCAAGEIPTQEKILETLSQLEHVKRLIQSIKRNGGLTDPLIVKNDTLEVLEGNSRLAAYRILSQSDPIKWAKVHIRLLPETITDSQIFSLLGEYHVTGKKDWSPFEVASYVYRRHVRHKVSKDRIARELSLTSRQITHMIAVVQFMADRGEETPNRWSYYDEYLKSNVIAKARREHPDLDKTVVKQIQSGVITKAADIRDVLKVVASSGDKNLKKYIQEERSLVHAYESAKARGADNILLNKLKRARSDFSHASIDEELQNMENEMRDKCKFELRKLQARFDQLFKKADRAT